MALQPQEDAGLNMPQGPLPWDSETQIERRAPENILIRDNGALGSMYTIRECFVRVSEAISRNEVGETKMRGTVALHAGDKKGCNK